MKNATSFDTFLNIKNVKGLDFLINELKARI
ncbi:Hypothetical Protein SLY_0952 [Strawberry lethal yellows phytoplasma (CPA) str. NZSb11]|uniref:Uncharacterized protein n=1 Tax=Strawberry lethal yellows phytoplasma (CPA) str. NZSb11 TaxID=980422 RepID=R4RQT0_PHYAS|nr:Hypothetical Protein SLY_0004 [Strawberry lethal yellows phytoplasma (CPA) str. NZSb11]AGL90551.1 Hypothetical Protein SLY_0635 [Strawberry lethal yellows phytoplasma (CPA) str. NZSb11]AGL90601.1 Hypothetical Protein SLY_0686 [Strawberry lethal yellows phytoplasma (CPA) str. NZSb11]AGL90866.1 Hypothetical Protein SLY_0952 [Strawberry lethal yellows phytoplasma (CPA) str. NZSb11]